jgi:hydrogenase/urease accessory protein HupE
MAHEVRPAYLEIAQSDADTYRIVWKQPTLGEVALRLVPVLSNGWLERRTDQQYAAAGYLIRTWNIRSGPTETLAGATLAIDGLQFTITDVLVRVRLLNARPIEAILRPETPRLQIQPEGHAVALPLFLVHGVEHILGGVDHLLFLLGLLLLVRDRWMLLRAVTAFTVAHSITLAISVLGKATLPGAYVETLIALSILFLGAEVLRAHRGGSSFTIRHPWAAAFFFGLFHGMGFAGGLRSLGFADGDVLAGLALFNFGVEVGQVAFVAMVVVLARGLSPLGLGRVLGHVPAYVIGVAGAYWTWKTGASLLGVV